MWSELFPSFLSTPLQRHLIMKTLTHLHGYVWSKLHSKPHQIRIICECKTLFFLFLAPPPHTHTLLPWSVFSRWALQGTCSNDEGVGWGDLQFFNVLWRPELCPTPPTERDRSHPQLSQDLICTPTRPTPKLDWASSDWCDVQAAH